MPRLPRLELPGMPLHVTQRGINKGAIFLDAEDRYHFRHLLRRAFRDHGIALHAFVLMDNHFHLLLTPGAVGTLSRAMGSVGQSYVQAFNLRHMRCGALWQGRFKSCLVQSEHYLLTVMRYIELNPVRAAMVDAPEDYRWSSVHTHLARARDPLITPHPLYLAMGHDQAERAHAYRQWLDAETGTAETGTAEVKRHENRFIAHATHPAFPISRATHRTDTGLPRRFGAPMPRQARLEIPGIPLHITQRGVNRCAIFLDDEDRRHYLRLLGESAARHGLYIHAYVLMGNHVHLLVSSDASGKVSLAMRQLGQAYVTAFNRRHRRSGTLWEGRFKSCLVDSDRYLLTAYRYIELNPVRAAMVERPEHHHWSSVHANLALCEDSLVTPHPCFIEMGTTPQARAEAYRTWLEQGVSKDELIAIRKHLQQERAFGSKRFQAMAEKTLGRPVNVRRPGRPRRDEDKPESI